MLRHDGIMMCDTCCKKNETWRLVKTMWTLLVLEAIFFDLSTTQGEEGGNYQTLATNLYTQQDKTESDTFGDVFVESGKQIENLTLIVFYNKPSNVIQYNISWDAFENSFRESYLLEINLISIERKFCTVGHTSYRQTLNKDVVSVIAPRANNIFELTPNCSYEVTLTVEPINNPILKIVNDIPECVDSKCNCGILMPDISNLTITEISSEKYKVSWLYRDMRRNNITEVLIDFINILCENESSSMNSCKISTTAYNFSSNYAFFSAPLDAGHYIFDVSVLNSFGCYVIETIKFKVKQSEEFRHAWIWILVLVCALGLLIVFCRKYQTEIWTILNNIMWRREYETSYMTVPYTNNPRIENPNWLGVNKEIVNGRTDNYEFPRPRLRIIKLIGRGAFGEVYLAEDILSEVTSHVAVKILPAHAAEEMQSFLAEIQTMKKIGKHPNIVTLIGCCTLNEPYMLIMEYVPCGDLKEYLKGLRKKWQIIYTNSGFTDTTGEYIKPGNPISSRETKPSVSTKYTDLNDSSSEIDFVLDHNELQNFAFQIANGMAYLEKLTITHRDLAARNVLIDEHKTLKISDFGMSRYGTYVNRNGNKCPLRWMSIEAIVNHLYTNKSDVWAFAVVLWEIGTLGAFPYEKVPNELLQSNLEKGVRLDRPEICTDDLYELMMKCWSREPENRPSFEQLVTLLSPEKRKVYVDFSLLNPLYVFPPTDFEQSSNVEPPSNNEESSPEYIECA